MDSNCHAWLQFVLLLKLTLEIILPSAALPEFACTLSSSNLCVFSCCSKGLRLAQPGNSLSILPFTLSLGLFSGIVVDTSSMLKFLLELSNILIAVYHILNTMTLSLSIFVIALVSTLIWPCHLTFSMHFIVDKFTFISFASNINFITVNKTT